jgi:hypothetical protein
MLRVIVGACAVVMMLSSCSSGDAASPPPPGTSAPKSSEPGAPNPTSVLEKLTEDKMCALITKASIERALPTAMESAKGMRRGKLPMFLIFECRYDAKGLPSVSTDLETINPSDSDQKLLDRVFTDVSSEEKKVGEYQKVTGIGTLAGFGADPLLAGSDLAASKLGVVATINGERLLLTVKVVGNTELGQVQAPPTLPQIQPLAEELLTNLKSAVG